MASNDKRSTTRSDKSTMRSEYPMNQVFETPGGHIVHIDNTPGSERIFVRHASGSFIEMGSDGRVQTYNVGDVKTYNKAGSTTSTDENSDHKTIGHSRHIIGGGLHAEVAGAVGVAFGGDFALVGMGAVNARAKTIYFGSDGSISIHCEGNLDIQVGGTTTINSKGNMTLQAPRIDLNPK